MLSTRRFLAATGVAALGFLATAVPAGAATPPDSGEVTPLSNNCIEFKNAVGCFDDYGDKIRVHDKAADGLRPTVQWQTDYGREGSCTYRGTSSWTTCNYNMAEGHRISFRVLQRSSSNSYASNWVGDNI